MLPVQELEKRIADWAPASILRLLHGVGPRKRRNVDRDDTDPGRPKIGLALSSGGAKGLAHIGVIQVLEEQGIPIDAIAGTSMGAYVGACWAAGHSSEELENLASDIQTNRDRLRLVDPIFPPRKGFIRGMKIRERLDHSINRAHFEDLDRRFYVVATEMGTYEAHVFESGNVAEAVHASLSIPGICKPVEIDGKFFVDGGVSSPVPVQTLLDAGMDKVIAVSVIPTVEELQACRDRERVNRKRPKGLARVGQWLNQHLNYFAEGNILQVLRNSAMGSQIRVAEFCGALADVYLRPIVCTGSWHDYHNYRYYIDEGRAVAEANLERIRALVEEPDSSNSMEGTPNNTLPDLAEGGWHSLKNLKPPRTMITQLFLDPHWDSMPPEKLRVWQVAKLRRYLESTVLPFSANYREMDIEPDQISTLEDLRHIPFTRKRDLLNTEENPQRARDFVLIPDEDILKRRASTVAKAMFMGRNRVKDDFDREFRPVLMTSTTGRSSDPVPFFYTAHDLRNLQTAGVRMMEICESSNQFKHLNLFPFAPHLAFWLAHYACLGANAFNLSTGGGKTMGTEGNVSLMNKIKPDAVIGMPTFIYHVLTEAVNQGIRWSNLQRIVLGGEKVPEGMRRKLRSLCAEIGSDDVDIMATYGFTEAKMAWPECPVEPGEPSTGYHLYPDLGIFEVVDPETGEPVPEGNPGEIVFTPLDSRGSVILRYRTGDQISEGLTYEPCPACGRSIPRLVGKISRVSDYRRLHIDKVKGTLVNFNELEHILDDIDGVGSWQIEIGKVNDDPLAPDELTVHIHSHSVHGKQSKQELVDRIRNKFYIESEIRPNKVEFHSAAEMRTRHGVGEKLKEEKVIDRRPASVRQQDVSDREVARDEQPTPTST